VWVQDFVDCFEGSTYGQPRVAEALSIKQQHLPKRIYKYRRDCSDSRRNLDTDTVWLSSPDSYNDPYDCCFRFSKDDLLETFSKKLVDNLVKSNKLQGVVSAEQIENAKRNHEPLKTIANHISESSTAKGNLKQMVEFCSTRARGIVDGAASTIQQWRKLTKVCSFSAINDSLLMWGHYADNHRGFCLEYDLEGLGAEHPLREKLYPVIYSNKIYDLTPWARTLVLGDRLGFNTELPILCVIHKCDQWRYEKEWRKVLVTHTVEADRDCPVPTTTRVFLGSKMESTKVKELLAICAHKKIEVWQMRLAEDKFELLPERLDG
jgi:hypothetical protein